MHRVESLPEELHAWVRAMPKEKVQALVRSSIERRASKLGLSIEPTELPAMIEKLDERYFAADEDGRKADAIELFRQARVMSAIQFLFDGVHEDALYEFFHSLADDTAEGAIAELRNA